MKQFLKLGIQMIVFSVLFSCEGNGTYPLFNDCNDCFSEEPTSAKLDIKLDIMSFTNTKITIYEGNLEDSIIYKSFTSITSEVEIPVSINKKYTVTAKYFFPGRNYTTVDSTTPKVKYDKESCNDPCYYIYDKKIDLRLKHTK